MSARVLRRLDDDAIVARTPSALQRFVKPNACTGCKHGSKCAGQCGKRVCAAHSYGCSKCAGQLCEPCFDAHELRGRHE